MSLSVVSSTEHTYASGTPLTTYTFSALDIGSRTHGWVAVHLGAASATSGGYITDAAFGASSLSSIIESSPTTVPRSEWWLVTEVTGQEDLVINIQTAGFTIGHLTVVWGDAAVEPTVGDTDTNTADEDPSVVTLTTNAAGALMLSGYGTQDNSVAAVDDETLLQDYDAGGNCFGTMYEIGGAAGNYDLTWDRNAGGQSSNFQHSAFELYEAGGGSPPTIALNTSDAQAFATDQPTVEFTGTDPDGDDVRYNVQIADNAAFDSGSRQTDNYYSATGQLSVHPQPTVGTTTWFGDPQVDDRPGQSFTAGGGILDSIELQAGSDQANCDGTMYVRVYEHAGTYGTSSTPADPADPADTPTPGWLAVSDGVAISGVPIPPVDWVTFDFSGSDRIRLVAGTYYELIADFVPNDGNSDNYCKFLGSTDLGHDGNAYIDGASVANNGIRTDFDLLFRVNEVGTLIDAVSGTDSGFANTVTGGDTDPFNSGEKADYDVQSGDALADSTYYWRARAKDPTDTDTYSDWATARSFTVTYAQGLNATPGIFHIAGTDASLEYARIMAAATDAFSIAGTAASLEYSHLVSAATGGFTISGTDASLLADRTLSAVSGTFATSGTDASLLYEHVLSAASGTIAISGSSVSEIYDRLLSSTSGVVTISGTDAALTYSEGAQAYTLTATSGNFAISGMGAGLIHGYLVPAGFGAFAWTGTDVGFLVDHILAAASAAIVVAGTDVTFSYTQLSSTGGGFGSGHSSPAGGFMGGGQGGFVGGSPGGDGGGRAL